MDLRITEEGGARIHEPGGATRPAPAELHDDIARLWERLVAERERAGHEFHVDHDGVRYRAACFRSLSGIRFVLRRNAEAPPGLETLGLPPRLAERLLRPDIRSGLVLLSGEMGSGKTTTASSLLRECLLRHGGAAEALESPPEFALEGEAEGWSCDQVSVGARESFFPYIVSAMRHSLRYLLVGEMRSEDDVVEVLRAATSGHLVISTVHAGSVEQTLQRMAMFASGRHQGQVWQMLADAVVAVVNQRLVKPRGEARARLQAEALLALGGEAAPVRALIRSGELHQLGTEIERQRAQWVGGPAAAAAGAAP